MKKVITLLALLNIAVFAQQKGTFTDPRDNKKYNTVKIGELIWFAQNLDYRGSDGYMGLCYGDKPKQNIKKPENCKIYGRLYDLKEAKQACPDGWHLPSKGEWNDLVEFAGDYEVAGNKLKSKTGWKAYDFSGKNPKAPKCKWIGTDERGRPVEHNKCATDEYGFSALPGGGICKNCPSTAGEIGYWWPSDGSYDANTNSYDVFQIHNHTEDTFMSNFNMTSRFGGNSSYYHTDDLFSVRCVQKDPEVVARKAAEAEAAKKAAEEEAIRKAAEAEAARIAAEAAELKKQQEKEASIKNGFTDPRDSKKYKAVKIGNQIWFAENLNFDVKGIGSACYDDKLDNCKKYGKLYNWERAKEACPSGWHLPSDEEWDILLHYADGTSGTKSYSKTAGKFLKSKSGWNNNGNGEDKFGFSALPSGNYHKDRGFNDVGIISYWWSSSNNKYNAYFYRMNSNNDGFSSDSNDKSYNLFSVRCIMD